MKEAKIATSQENGLIFSKKNERLQLRFPELMLADLFP
jgi:hypothetical protein